MFSTGNTLRAVYPATQTYTHNTAVAMSGAITAASTSSQSEAAVAAVAAAAAAVPVASPTDRLAREAIDELVENFDIPTRCTPAGVGPGVRLEYVYRWRRSAASN